MTRLTQDLAARFAGVTLSHLGQHWPYKLDQVLTGPADIAAPIDLHPIFHGSFDWHSCVHGWWQVMRLARLFPDAPHAAQAIARANEMLVPDKVAGELAYLDRPMTGGFERPYGWAWLLALHDELARHDNRNWADALAPLARAFADRLANYLPRLTYPIRVGTHTNTAFALFHARRWALARDPALTELIDRTAIGWFSDDRARQAWEPCGDEFLSPVLSEALLMSTILHSADFRVWFDAFLPEAASGRPETLFVPAHVSDRTDGKIAHLDGLNFARAWCWRGIATALGAGHGVGAVAEAAAERHIAASLPHVADNYMGSHWLCSFALLALEAAPSETAPR